MMGIPFFCTEALQPEMKISTVPPKTKRVCNEVANAVNSRDNTGRTRYFF
jgi:hypothetical protein